MRIALDAMGGDYAPTNIVSGAILALREYHRISKLFLVGDRDQIIRHLGEQNYEDQRVEVVHTTQVIEMSDPATESVRRKRNSSVSMAVDLVKMAVLTRLSVLATPEPLSLPRLLN